MPNKNSIESEIDKLIQMIPVWFNIALHKSMEDGDPKHNKEYQKKAKQQIKKLIQREVKKGRVEELKKLNENLIKSGVEEKAEERIMLVIDDRLEELG